MTIVLCCSLLGALAGSNGLGGTLSRRAALAVSAGGVLLPAANPQPAAAVDSGVPTTKLGSLTISRTIQGYWQLAGGHGPYKEEDAVANMKDHFAAGITTLDTADIYGPSELIVGQFVKGQPAAVPCTKFCCFRGLQSLDMAQVRARVLKSCERLQVDSLPLVAFFWSDYSVKRYVEVSILTFRPRTASFRLLGRAASRCFCDAMRLSGPPRYPHESGRSHQEPTPPLHSLARAALCTSFSNVALPPSNCRLRLSLLPKRALLFRGGADAHKAAGGGAHQRDRAHQLRHETAQGTRQGGSPICLKPGTEKETRHRE